MRLSYNRGARLRPIRLFCGAATTAVVLLILFAGCRKPEAPVADDSFDRGAMLVQYADALILPGYAQFRTDLENFSSTLDLLQASPETGALAECRSALHAAWRSWQSASLYDFGPALDQGLLNAVNLYPANEASIVARVETGDFTFGTPTSLDASGFAALDFLLHGEGVTDAEVLDRLVGNAWEQPAIDYTKAVCGDLLARTNATIQEWNGSYRSTFIAATGTDVGSAMGLMLNAFNRVYEQHIRKLKLGLPSGLMTFSQTPLPTHVEGFYAPENSVTYLLEALEATAAFFTGADGTGLDDYLNTLDAQYHDTDLSLAIVEHLQAAHDACAGLTSPLSQAVVDSPAPVAEAYTELQQLVVLFKVDMMSELGILITYQDNDGD